MTDRRCKVCDRLIAAKRQSSYPHAKTCGKRQCFLENRRRVHNDLARRIKRRREKTPAHREPVASRGGLIDTFLRTANRIALGALRRAHKFTVI